MNKNLIAKIAESIIINIIMSIYVSFIFHVIPIVIFPVLFFIWIIHIHDLPSLFNIYSNIYEYLWIFCIFISICATCYDIFRFDLNFSLNEKELLFLVKISENPKQANWIERLYFRKNRKWVEAYKAFCVTNEHFDIYLFSVYLERTWPSLYYKYTKNSYKPWIGIQYISSHIRSGHIRHTRNGPVNVRSHSVQGYTRSRW